MQREQGEQGVAWGWPGRAGVSGAPGSRPEAPPQGFPSSLSPSRACGQAEGGTGLRAKGHHV